MHALFDNEDVKSVVRYICIQDINENLCFRIKVIGDTVRLFYYTYLGPAPGGK